MAECITISASLEAAKFLKEIIDDFQFVAKQKNLALIFESEQKGIKIKGDDFKLSQVFRNLIDNAIKYTEKGWVKIKLTTNDLQPATALITVSDSGRGMSKESITNLFQKFFRRIEDERILGSGLGLYISRKIVEDHKGRIWAESEGEGKGSKFFVLLPAVKE